MADLSSCGAIARAHDPDRFLIALFAPATHREALFTLIAFNHELARALDTAAASRGDYSAMGGHVRLQWWREVVDGDPKRHEVATPLAALLDDDLRPILLGMIDARTTELDGFDTAQTWREALLAGPGGLLRAAARILGAPEASHAAIAAVGAAYAVGKILRHRSTLLALNRRPMPDAMLNDENQAETIAQGRAFLAQGRGLRLPQAQRALILPAVLAKRDLNRAARSMPQDAPRALADRLAVTAAFLTGLT